MWIKTIKQDFKLNVSGKYTFFTWLNEDWSPDMSTKVWEAENHIQWNFLDWLSAWLWKEDATNFTMSHSWRQCNMWALADPALFIWDDATASTMWDGNSWWSGFSTSLNMSSWTQPWRYLWSSNSSYAPTDNMWVVKNQIEWPIPRTSYFNSTISTTSYTAQTLFYVNPENSFTAKELWIISAVKWEEYNKLFIPLSRANCDIVLTAWTPIYILYTLTVDANQNTDNWYILWWDLVMWWIFWNYTIWNSDSSYSAENRINWAWVWIDASQATIWLDSSRFWDAWFEKSVDLNQIDDQTWVDDWNWKIIRKTTLEFNKTDVAEWDYGNITLFVDFWYYAFVTWTYNTYVTWSSSTSAINYTAFMRKEFRDSNWDKVLESVTATPNAVRIITDVCFW